jgi:hypothetical protein
VKNISWACSVCPSDIWIRNVKGRRPFLSYMAEHVQGSFRTDWDSPGIQVERWWKLHYYPSAHSTYSPLGSMHHCHLSSNFLMNAENQSFGTVHTDSRTPLCKLYVLFDGWYRVWYCHAALTLSVPLCDHWLPNNDLQSNVRESVYTIQKVWFAASTRKLPERW